MLSRTADHLFWMARYMERAENTARMLDVNYQTSLLPQSASAAENGWRGLLSISELSADYNARYGEINAQKVMAYMMGDEKNPSSIYNCLLAARENETGLIAGRRRQDHVIQRQRRAIPGPRCSSMCRSPPGPPPRSKLSNGPAVAHTDRSADDPAFADRRVEAALLSELLL